MIKLKPSQVKSNPSRFNHDRLVKIRFALGEITSIALPLRLFNLADSIQIGEIKESDKWNAQGLEGCGEITVTWAQAFVLCNKLDNLRATVLC